MIVYGDGSAERAEGHKLVNLAGHLMFHRIPIRVCEQVFSGRPARLLFAEGEGDFISYCSAHKQRCGSDIKYMTVGDFLDQQTHMAQVQDLPPGSLIQRPDENSEWTRWVDEDIENEFQDWEAQPR